MAEPRDTHVGTILAEWDYPEYIQFERGWRWYVIAIVITVALLVYSFFTDNQLFMIIILLAAIIFTLANMRQPERIKFYITDKGVVIRDKFLNYRDIKNFWMIYQPPSVKNLFIEPKSFIIPRLAIHLEDQNPVEIRNMLLQYLQEDLDKEDEPQSDFFGRLLKL
ncbi:MAG: hypothetical protein V1846_01045 [Candidatus Komeilibacteria bacterium]